MSAEGILPWFLVIVTAVPFVRQALRIGARWYAVRRAVPRVAGLLATLSSTQAMPTFQIAATLDVSPATALGAVHALRKAGQARRVMVGPSSGFYDYWRGTR